MTSQSCTSPTCTSFGPMIAMTRLPGFLSRHTVALAVGWLAYGLAYLMVAAVLVGLPLAVALYLLGALPG